MPDYLVLHWDGNVIHYESGSSDDRLCIEASFPGTDQCGLRADTTLESCISVIQINERAK